MSTRETVIIASRALAVYLLFWFVSDLTYLPSNMFSLWHHRNMLGATEWTTYLRNSDVISISFRLLRMAGLFFAVQWFIARVQQYNSIFWTPRTNRRPSRSSPAVSAYPHVK